MPGRGRDRLPESPAKSPRKLRVPTRPAVRRNYVNSRGSVRRRSFARRPKTSGRPETHAGCDVVSSRAAIILISTHYMYIYIYTRIRPRPRVRDGSRLTHGYDVTVLILMTIVITIIYCNHNGSWAYATRDIIRPRPRTRGPGVSRGRGTDPDAGRVSASRLRGRRCASPRLIPGIVLCHVHSRRSSLSKHVERLLGTFSETRSKNVSGRVESASFFFFFSPRRHFGMRYRCVAVTSWSATRRRLVTSSKRRRPEP